MKGLRAMACVYAVVPCFFFVRLAVRDRLPWLPFIVFFCFAIRLWLAPCLSGASSALIGKGCFFCNLCQPLIFWGAKADKQKTALKKQTPGF